MKRLIIIDAMLTAILVGLLYLCLARHLDLREVRQANVKHDITTVAKAPALSREAIAALLNASSALASSTGGNTADALNLGVNRAVTLSRYAYFLGEFANLDPLVRKQLLELLSQRASAKSRIVRGHPNSTDEEKVALIAQELDRIDQSIAILCGPEGNKARDLLKLDAGMYAIQLNLAAEMRFADVPLTKEQMRQLAAVMQPYVLNPEYRDYLSRREQSDDPAVKEAAVRDAAKAFLSPQQLEVLARYQHSMELNRALAAEQTKPAQ